jgi:hypothetical protein
MSEPTLTPFFIDWLDLRYAGETKFDVFRNPLPWWSAPLPGEWVSWPIIGDVLYSGQTANSRRRAYAGRGSHGQAAYWSADNRDAFLSMSGGWISWATRLQPPGGYREGWWLLEKGKDERCTIQRIDLAFHCSHVSGVEITKASGLKVTRHEVRGVLTGWTVGSGDCLLRVYRKDKHDPEGSCAERFPGLIGDKDEPGLIWRVELQLRADWLERYDIARALAGDNFTDDLRTYFAGVFGTVLDMRGIRILNGEDEIRPPQTFGVIPQRKVRRPDIEHLLKQAQGCVVSAVLAAACIKVPPGMDESTRATWADELAPEVAQLFGNLWRCVHKVHADQREIELDLMRLLN